MIDVHNHVNDPGGIHGEEISPAELIGRMDRVNVSKIVILTGMWGDQLQSALDKMVKPYPDRFLVFTQIDWSKINDPDFSVKMVAQLDDAVRRGARGLKVLKDLGLGVRDKSGKPFAVDDPRLDPVWEECGRLSIPVAIHTSDPEAFFTPVDNHNERYEELKQNPTWSFYGSQFPSNQTLLDERNHVFEKHPRTTFIALHVANWPENLDAVSASLDKYPNMYVEFGTRQGRIGPPTTPRLEVFFDYQDRILRHRLRARGRDVRQLFPWLETADEYSPYWGYPVRAGGKSTGWNCPTRFSKRFITRMRKGYFRNSKD